MKFGKRWKTDVSKLPMDVQVKCISYKQWKCRCKTFVCQDPEVIGMTLKELKSEAKGVDDAFKHIMNRDASFVSFLVEFFLPCMGYSMKAKVDESHRLAYDYATLNATCLAKVCKRADKCCKTKEFTSWLIQSKNEHTYSFLGGRDMTVLRIRFQLNILGECPVCLEPLNNDSRAILNCGHVICITCAKKILHIPANSNMFGESEYYLLRCYQNQNAGRTVCPCCRCHSAFMHITVLR